ncbi:MAG TPA: hypothetical protein VIT63_07270 [Nitrospira sp.]
MKSDMRRFLIVIVPAVCACPDLPPSYRHLYNNDFVLERTIDEG